MKPRRHVVPLCLIAFALLAPRVAQAQQPGDKLRHRIEQWRAGRAASSGLQELQVQGRKVLVHVPAGYDPAHPAPLVLAFHGGGVDRAGRERGDMAVLRQPTATSRRCIPLIDAKNANLGGWRFQGGLSILNARARRWYRRCRLARSWADVQAACHP
jgi:hypothetical protein